MAQDRNEAVMEDLPADLESSRTPPVHTDEDENAKEKLGQGAPPAKPAPTQRTKLEIFLVMAASCMSVFLAALDNTIITTALPTIAEHFGSAAGFVWVGSGFMLAAAVTTANWGKFSDVWGRKPVLQAASAIFILGCALCGASVNLTMLIAGRVVQGVGAGGLLTLVNIIIGDLFSPRERGKYYGMIGMVWASASALGPVIGGALTSNASWRWCFYLNLPISGLAFVIIFFALKLPSAKTGLLEGLKAIDWLGSILITGGSLMILMGLQFGGSTYPWKSAPVICLIIFGAVTLAIFGVVERYAARYPVIPVQLFATRSNVACLAVDFFHGMAFTQVMYYLPTYFQAVLGASALLSGVWLLGACVGVSLAATTTGIYIKRTGRYMDPIVLGFVLAVLGAGLLYDLPRTRHDPSSASSWARIIVYQVVVGAGTGFLFQPPLIALQSSVSPQHIASVTASFALVRNMAFAIGVVGGSAAFVNKMAAQRPVVLAAVGGDEAVADQLTGANAQANLFVVDALPAPAKAVVRRAMYNGIREIWLQTVCFAAVGLLVCFFIQRKKLQTEHETVQTGLAGEQERRRLADAEKARKAAEKQLPK